MLFGWTIKYIIIYLIIHFANLIFTMHTNTGLSILLIGNQAILAFYNTCDENCNDIVRQMFQGQMVWNYSIWDINPYNEGLISGWCFWKRPMHIYHALFSRHQPIKYTLIIYAQLAGLAETHFVWIVKDNMPSHHRLHMQTSSLWCMEPVECSCRYFRLRWI